MIVNKEIFTNKHSLRQFEISGANSSIDSFIQHNYLKKSYKKGFDSKLDTPKNTRDLLFHEFINPPNSAYPGVYWYFMDGNLSASGMTADLESMKKAGISHVIFLEVNVGVPRGPIDYLSPE